MSDYVPNELRVAFEDRAGYKPVTHREENAFRKITERWLAEGITPRMVRQAIRGFWTAHPTDAASPQRVDFEFSAFVALVTPRRPVIREDYGPRPGDVGPPPDVLERFTERKTA